MDGQDEAWGRCGRADETLERLSSLSSGQGARIFLAEGRSEVEVIMRRITSLYQSRSKFPMRQSEKYK